MLTPNKMEQRKIEGWIDGEPTQPPDPQTGFIASLMGSEANDGSSIPATLIIGGKGYTESEVKSLLMKIRNDYHAVEDIEFIDTLAHDELGIQLP